MAIENYDEVDFTDQGWHCCVERDATWPQQGSCLGH
jgi:hypothetical protein